MAQLNDRAWAQWVGVSLQQILDHNVMRSHRLLEPTASPIKACVPNDTYNALMMNDVSPLPPRLENSPSPPHEVTLFSTNDYLGLSTHPDVKNAVARCSMEYGMGPRSSPLVCGFTELHRQLELDLCDLKETEECILFPTGYAANLAVMSTLGRGTDVAIFSDELNHASIIDGCKLATTSGAMLKVYRHNNMDDLDQMLAVCDKRRKIVVTDSLFSMDGDFARLQDLVALKEKHGFYLVVDEAHATFVCGPSGGGACQQEGVSQHVDVHIGTLSKGAGALGGFVCCKTDIRQLLTSLGRTQVFSTALPLPVVAAALAAMQVMRRELWRRRHLSSLVTRLGEGLGIKTTSPIVPLLVGSEANALSFGQALLRRGFLVGIIRPPTVPVGTSRLRISLCASHSMQDVENLIVAIRQSGHSYSNLDSSLVVSSRL